MDAFSIEQDVAVAMRDGVILRCNILRPSAPGRYPVALLRTPYGKDPPNMSSGDMLSLAQQGFVCISQDCRQRFQSDGDGDFYPFAADAEDGVDTIEWAARLPYCNGAVVMVGASYNAFTQWAAAAQSPPSLRAIAPCVPPGNPYRSFFFQGGVFELSVTPWLLTLGANILERRNGKGSPELGDALTALAADLGDFSPSFTDLPVDQCGALSRLSIDYLVREALRPDALMHRAQLQAQNFSRVLVPAYICGGWYDNFILSTIDQFVGMRASAGTPHARDHTKLIIGPWSHGGFSWNVGERYFGFGSMRLNRSVMDVEQNYWFQKVLSGELDELGSPVKIFVMGANVWRDEQEWPLARAVETRLYLSSGGNANTLHGDGVLSPKAEASAPDHFIYNPANPVRTHGGNALGLTLLAGPRDQRCIEERHDVLVYSSAILDDDLEVTGPVSVELWASTSAEDTDFVARLVDVDPHGVAFNLCEGILRARYRERPTDMHEVRPIVPGEPTLYRIELSPTSNLFKRGHRIRLDVTSSCFPRWARNLGILNDRDATLADAASATQTVLHDEQYPSCVVLPVIPARRTT